MKMKNLDQNSIQKEIEIVPPIQSVKEDVRIKEENLKICKNSYMGYADSQQLQLPLTAKHLPRIDMSRHCHTQNENVDYSNYLADNEAGQYLSNITVQDCPKRNRSKVRRSKPRQSRLSSNKLPDIFNTEYLKQSDQKCNGQIIKNSESQNVNINIQQSINQIQQISQSNNNNNSVHNSNINKQCQGQFHPQLSSEFAQALHDQAFEKQNIEQTKTRAHLKSLSKYLDTVDRSKLEQVPKDYQKFAKFQESQKISIESANKKVQSQDQQLSAKNDIWTKNRPLTQLDVNSENSNMRMEQRDNSIFDQQRRNTETSVSLYNEWLFDKQQSFKGNAKEAKPKPQMISTQSSRLNTQHMFTNEYKQRAASSLFHSSITDNEILRRGCQSVLQNTTSTDLERKCSEISSKKNSPKLEFPSIKSLQHSSVNFKDFWKDYTESTIMRLNTLDRDFEHLKNQNENINQQIHNNDLSKSNNEFKMHLDNSMKVGQIDNQIKLKSKNIQYQQQQIERFRESKKLTNKLELINKSFISDQDSIRLNHLEPVTSEQSQHQSKNKNFEDINNPNRNFEQKFLSNISVDSEQITNEKRAQQQVYEHLCTMMQKNKHLNNSEMFKRDVIIDESKILDNNQCLNQQLKKNSSVEKSSENKKIKKLQQLEITAQLKQNEFSQLHEIQTQNLRNYYNDQLQAQNYQIHYNLDEFNSNNLSLNQKQQLYQKQQSQNFPKNQNLNTKMNQISLESTANQYQTNENLDFIDPNAMNNNQTTLNEMQNSMINPQQDFIGQDIKIDPIFNEQYNEDKQFNFSSKSSQKFRQQQSDLLNKGFQAQNIPNLNFDQTFEAQNDNNNYQAAPANLLKLQQNFNSVCDHSVTTEQQGPLTLSQQQSCPIISLNATKSNLNPDAACFYPKWMKQKSTMPKAIFKVIHTNNKKKHYRKKQRQIQKTIMNCCADSMGGYDQPAIAQPQCKINLNSEQDQKFNKQDNLKQINNMVQDNDFFEPMLPMVPLTDRQRNLSPDKTNAPVIQSTLQQNTQNNSLVFNKSRTCIKEPDIQKNEDMQCCEDNDNEENIQVKPLDLTSEIQRMERLKEFKKKHEEFKSSGILYCQILKDSHECLQQKELIDSTRKFCADYIDNRTDFVAVRDPLQGHKITKEYRTKMTDWMIEVCSSFKCSPRTYFLSVTILDKYLTACHQHGMILENKDIHKGGVVAMYLASKYEDVFPLHSKIVSEKIAHNAISPMDIVRKEREFLALFEFQMDFVTHFDFHQTYCDKVEKQINYNLKSAGNLVTQEFIAQCQILMSKLSDMALYLTKMAIQCIDFCPYSPSILVISAIYSATAFLKHSKTYQGEDTARFCTEVRKIIFQIIQEELQQQQCFLPKLQQDNNDLTFRHIQIYQNQFQQDFVEQVAMDLVDFQKLFDEWHCGLNQLKKFHPIPFE